MLRFLAAVMVCVALLNQSGPVLAQDVSDPAAIAPDVALLVSGAEAEQLAELVPRLGTIPGVDKATTESLDEDEAVVYLALVESGDPRPAEAVAREAVAEIQRVLPDAEILIGGSNLVDEALKSRFRTSANWVVALALLLGLAAGAPFGRRRSAVAGVALLLAALCAGSLGAQISGPFDGTVTTTAVPGTLAGLVAGLAVGLRLLLWFRTPQGVDGADTMRRAVSDLLPELALVFSGLAVTAFVVEFFNPGRSPLTVVTVGAGVAVLVMTAVLAPALTLFGAADRGEGVLAEDADPGAVGRSSGEVPVERSWLPLAFPDGRDFPLLVIVSIALVLVAISLFAFGQPSRLLIGHEELGDDIDAAVVAERLVSTGDPTNALVAVKPDAVEPADFLGWAGAVVERPEVAWVDTGSGRLTSIRSIDVADTSLLVPPGSEDVAVIVLAVSPRSVDGQDVVARLAAIPLAGGPPDFEGEASETARVVGSRTPLLLSVVLFALVAAGAIFVMTQNRATAAVAFVLRIVGAGATLGILRLMVVDITAAEALVVLTLFALGLGLYELEFLRVVNDRHLDAQPGAQPGSRFGPGTDGPLGSDRSNVESGGTAIGVLGPNPGQNAGLAFLSLGFAGLALSVSAPLGGGPGMGQFGLGILVAAVIEVLLGLIVLRPALLGHRAAFHTAVRPVRIALHSGVDRQARSDAGPEDPAWRRTVSDLLQAEFRLQSEPGSAVLDTVFVPDTPLFKQAVTHHANLASASLRIVGRSPQLRSLKTVSGRSPVTLAVTVDHPARHLIDDEGTVVGVRRPERRSGVLWLSPADDGGYRIAESVELGSVPLPGHDPDEDMAADPGGDSGGDPAEDETTGEYTADFKADDTADHIGGFQNMTNENGESGRPRSQHPADPAGGAGLTSPPEPLLP